MKIIFIGCVKFSYTALKELVSQKADIVGVIGSESSSINSDYQDIAPICTSNKIPFIYSKNINDEDTVNWINKLNPDIIFCFGWSRLISKKVLLIPPMGVVGYHPSVLPENRGRHPIIWTLALGLSEIGSTFFFMQEEADNGDILSQKKIKVLDNDNAMTLYQKLTKVSLIQIREFLPKLINNNFEKIPQDNTKSNKWRKRSAKDGLIDWRMAAENIHNLVRALTKPYVGAEFLYLDQSIKVWATEIIYEVEKNIEPGKVISSNQNFLIIKTGSHAIKINKMEPQLVLEEGIYL